MLKTAAEPNFLIIGAAKAATTSLASLLNQHPDAAIVRGKEPHYFSFDNLYNLGWNKYLELYEHCANESAIGDASTSYSRIRYHPKVIQRIKHHIPDVKIIYMVRSPLERMESAYIMHNASPGGMKFNSISDAVTRQPMIVDSSRYWEVFDSYRQHFPEDQIKIVWFEDYIKNRLSVYKDVCRFLEIDDNYEFNAAKEITNDRSNVLDRATKLGQNNIPINLEWDLNIRKMVVDAIRDDNLTFLQHFGKPSDHWGGLFD